MVGWWKVKVKVVKLAAVLLIQVRLEPNNSALIIIIIIIDLYSAFWS